LSFNSSGITDGIITLLYQIFLTTTTTTTTITTMISSPDNIFMGVNDGVMAN